VRPDRETQRASGFGIVRRGYDPQEVAEHLRRLESEMQILSTDRDASVERAARAEDRLEAAHAEVHRLRTELRAMAGAPDSVSSMSERLSAMLRLTRDEVAGLLAGSASALIAGVEQEIGQAVATAAGDAGNGGAPAAAPAPGTGRPTEPAALSPVEADREIERMRREAAEERARLHEAAVAERTRADEEFRVALALRCREAQAQVARVHATSLRTAREILDRAAEQARTRLDEADSTARRMVADARQEVENLHAVRERLREDILSTRSALDQALPQPTPQDPAPPPAPAAPALPAQVTPPDERSAPTAAITSGS
jgi:hypothetical protein